MVTPVKSQTKKRLRIPTDATGARPIVDQTHKCPDCGGLLDVEPAPKHAAGCVCEHRRNVILPNKDAIAKHQRRGCLDEDTLIALARGEFDRVLHPSTTAPPVPPKEPACPPTKQLSLPTSSPKRATPPRRTSSKKAK